ncbi:hypothetical protein IFM12275_61980 [Nocardia sputorum]|uniref:YybH family protein n=1 Tax=Nocardia sputorum TaxID=2984338 RepID=UPI002491344F|nr:nuclear transport factor 2 family protein [Nocardia sputorum]BDT96222.1 hypothetical protein IFM12275_61980 [Nocardia sputorum]
MGSGLHRDEGRAFGFAGFYDFDAATAPGSSGESGWDNAGMDFRAHADAWLAAWNAHDLDAIMACYSDEVEFVASTVARRWDRPDGRLHGKAELRKHFELGLSLAPDLAFTEEALLIRPGGYALLYRRENGNRVLDVVELDQDGHAGRVEAFYEHEQR